MCLWRRKCWKTKMWTKRASSLRLILMWENKAERKQNRRWRRGVRSGKTSFRYKNGCCVQMVRSSSTSASLSVFVHLIYFVGAIGRGLRGVSGRTHVHFVHLLECLVEVVLQGGHGRTDGRRAEAVGDEAEVSQAALNPWLENGSWPRVSQRRSVLSQQVGELLTDLPERLDDQLKY